MSTTDPCQLGTTADVDLYLVGRSGVDRAFLVFFFVQFELEGASLRPFSSALPLGARVEQLERLIKIMAARDIENMRIEYNGVDFREHLTLDTVSPGTSDRC